METWTEPSALRVSGPTMAISGRASRRAARVSTAPGVTSASGFRNSTKPARPARQPRLQAAAKPSLRAFTSSCARGWPARTASTEPSRLALSTTVTSSGRRDVAGEGIETGEERRAAFVGDDDHLDARRARPRPGGRGTGLTAARPRRAPRACGARSRPTSSGRRAPARSAGADRPARRRAARSRARRRRRARRAARRAAAASPKTSPSEGCRLTTSGTPRAAASRAGRPKPSYSERKTAASAAA